nr:phenoloxidase-activating factor 2-like [Drosophila kikkawai]
MANEGSPDSQLPRSEHKVKSFEAESDGDDCGLSNPNGLDADLEVKAEQARCGEFPWAIAVFSNGKYLGGGSLIAPGAVLTAAHLLRGKSEANIVVRAGEWDQSIAVERFPHEERSVKDLVRHEEFNYSSGANNLALLLLETPFEIQEHIRTICLPKEVKSLVGKRCMVAGWGRQSYPEKYNSDILKKIELPMVSRATCQRQLRNTVMGRTFSLAPSLICAGGELDKDACLGDGGSALFCALEKDQDRYEQVGIVNWSIECGKKDVPATYTNVAMFKDWIDRQLERHSESDVQYEPFSDYQRLMVRVPTIRPQRHLEEIIIKL